MSRLISAGAVVRDQFDVFITPTSSTRVTGLSATAVAAKVFVNNTVMPWTVQDGTNVSDPSVSAGTVYVNEISGAPGFYAVRFFTDRVGYWRVVLTVSQYSAEIIREYDVVVAGFFGSAPSGGGGLTASFVK